MEPIDLPGWYYICMIVAAVVNLALFTSWACITDVARKTKALAEEHYILGERIQAKTLPCQMVVLSAIVLLAVSVAWPVGTPLCLGFAYLDIRDWLRRRKSAAAKAPEDSTD